jgi:transposase
MPRPFPVEFRRRAIALVRAGKPITTAAVELVVSAAAIHNWVRQDQIDRGERPGITTPESIELAKVKKQIFATRGRSCDSEEGIAAVWGGCPTQKGSPDDRLTHRDRSSGQALMPSPQSQ